MATAAVNDQTVPMGPVLLQPLVLASAVEAIGRFFHHQGLPRLARACHAEASGKRGGRLCHTSLSTGGATASAAASDAGTDTAEYELAQLAHTLLHLTGRDELLSSAPHRAPPLGSSGSSGSGSIVAPGGRSVGFGGPGKATVEPALSPPPWRRSALIISHEALSFLWPLLPPYIERPSTIAALASLARLPCQAIRDDSRRLCVGHAHLHPNSLGPNEALDSWSEIGPRSNGILERLSFRALVSTQFHLPRLQEAFWLLEVLTVSHCHSLRKLVDRQSRWRPREQRFETLDEAGLVRAAALVDALGGLRSLRHLEGPMFSIILRACGQRTAKQQLEVLPSGGAEAGPLLAPHAWLEEADHDRSPDPTITARASPPFGIEARGFGDKLEVAYLMDTTKEDLLGFWEPIYPKLSKLVLLNLPATSPGLTARAVATFLPKVPNLTELQLDFAFFDPVSWDLGALELLLEQVQAQPSKVSKLFLEWCRLGDDGVRRVCETLSRYPAGAITELSLAHCEMRDVTTVCEMLETPDLSLTKLDLSSNTLDDCQAARLAKALPLSQVKELRLRDSQVSVPLPVKTEWFWGC